MSLLSKALLSMVLLTPAAAWADCLDPATASTMSIRGFVDDPSSLLHLFPHGTRVMEFKIAEIASASPKMLPLVRKIIPQANALQADAIGAGLARAAHECESTSSDFSHSIAGLALGSGSQDVMRGFVRDADEAEAVVLDDAASNRGTTGRVPGVAIDPSSKALPDPFKAIPIRKQ